MIEVLLANNLMNRIPDDIFILCYEFYKYFIKLGIAYSSRIDSTLENYTIMDIQSGDIQNYTFLNSPQLNHTLQDNESDSDSSSGSYGKSIFFSAEFMYHIDHLPTKLLDDVMAQYNKNDYSFIDAVLCKMMSKGIPYPCILFHGKYKNDNKILHQLVSKTKMPNFESICVCDARDAIYAQKDGKLYELKLSKIIDEAFEFEQIHDTFAWLDATSFARQISSKLEYIKNKNQLFAIKCEYHLLAMYETDRGETSRYRECGIYDFNKKQWKEIAQFKYKWHNSDFLCITTYDTRENVIYLVSHIGHTARYDCNENKWTILANEKSFINEINVFKGMNKGCDIGKIWIDGDKLKWASGAGIIRELELNTSKGDRKWIRAGVQIEATTKSMSIWSSVRVF